MCFLNETDTYAVELSRGVGIPERRSIQARAACSQFQLYVSWLRGSRGLQSPGRQRKLVSRLVVGVGGPCKPELVYSPAKQNTPGL